MLQLSKLVITRVVSPGGWPGGEHGAYLWLSVRVNWPKRIMEKTDIFYVWKKTKNGWVEMGLELHLMEVSYSGTLPEVKMGLGSHYHGPPFTCLTIIIAWA